MYACTYLYVSKFLCTYVYISLCVYTCMCERGQAGRQAGRPCMRLGMSVRTQAGMCVYVCIYVCTYVNRHVSVRIPSLSKKMQRCFALPDSEPSFATISPKKTHFHGCVNSIVQQHAIPVMFEQAQRSKFNSVCNDCKAQAKKTLFAAGLHANAVRDSQGALEMLLAIFPVCTLHPKS